MPTQQTDLRNRRTKKLLNTAFIEEYCIFGIDDIQEAFDRAIAMKDIIKVVVDLTK